MCIRDSRGGGRRADLGAAKQFRGGPSREREQTNALRRHSVFDEVSHAARQGNWKLVWEKTEKRWALYDLEKDRTETTDLSAKHPEKVAALKSAYEEWRQRTGAPAPRGPKKKATRK